MPLPPLNPSQDYFDDYDDIRSELSNYFYYHWKTTLARTEKVKFPNFPLKPLPTATETWVEWSLIYGRPSVKCVGFYNTKKLLEMTVLQRIYIHSPISVGNGGVTSVGDTISGMYPSSFALRSARLVPGRSSSYHEHGNRAYPEYSNPTGWYDCYVDTPIDVTVLG
jgi:hypothetical protein